MKIVTRVERVKAVMTAAKPFVELKNMANKGEVIHLQMQEDVTLSMKVSGVLDSEFVIAMPAIK